MVDYQTQANIIKDIIVGGGGSVAEAESIAAQFRAALEQQMTNSKVKTEATPPVGSQAFTPATSSSDAEFLSSIDTDGNGLTVGDLVKFKLDNEATSAAGDSAALEALNRVGDIIGSEHPQSFAEEEAKTFFTQYDTDKDGVLSAEELSAVAGGSSGLNDQNMQAGYQDAYNKSTSGASNAVQGTDGKSGLPAQNPVSDKPAGSVTKTDVKSKGEKAPTSTPAATSGQNIPNTPSQNTDGASTAKHTSRDTSQPQANEFISPDITSTTKSNGKAAIQGGGPNVINLANTTGKPMEVAFFQNFGPYEPNHVYADGVFTLQPGEKLEVAMPDDWQGRVQKWNGSTQNFANWAEINFEGSTDLIWFNESDIPGRNSSMTITSGDGEVAGSAESILDKAPKDLLVQDSSGEWVLKAPEWFTGAYSQGSVDFLNEHLGTQNAYVLPPDHDAVRRSQSNTLSIDFGEA